MSPLSNVVVFNALALIFSTPIFLSVVLAVLIFPRATIESLSITLKIQSMVSYVKEKEEATVIYLKMSTIWLN